MMRLDVTCAVDALDLAAAELPHCHPDRWGTAGSPTVSVRVGNLLLWLDHPDAAEHIGDALRRLADRVDARVAQQRATEALDAVEVAR